MASCPGHAGVGMKTPTQASQLGWQAGTSPSPGRRRPSCSRRSRPPSASSPSSGCSGQRRCCSLREPGTLTLVVSSHRFLEFAALAAVVIAIPGPSVMFTVSRALTAGRRVALLNVVGNEVGLVLQVVAAAFGMGAVVERSAEVFTVVKLLGAAYLVYLGVQAIRHRRSFAEAVGQRVGPMGPLRAVRDGMIVGATNPKTIAFFVVALTGVRESSGRGLGAPIPSSGPAVSRHRPRARQRLGDRRGHGQSVAVAITETSGCYRRSRRTRHDRPRSERGSHRTQGLIVRRVVACSRKPISVSRGRPPTSPLGFEPEERR